MNKSIRVLVVDESGCRESTVSDYTDYYPLLDCTTFTVVNTIWVDDNISIFCNDEGLYVSPLVLRSITGYPEPLAGNLVIAGGVDSIGRTLPCPAWLTPDNIDCFVNLYNN